MAVHDLDRIESKIDRVVANATEVSMEIGGVRFKEMAEILEMAKLMSLSDKAIPKHLRGNPGACLAICIQSLEWRMSPFSVANQSYEVNDRIAYQAALIHAVIEARAPLKQRLRFFYSGENETLACRVVGHFKGEVDPVELETPQVGKIKIKNSPLWSSDPRQQLAYYAARAFARRYCPDTLLGIYSEDELADSEIGPDRARDITPKLSERLKGSKGKPGFQASNVAALEHRPGETLPEAKSGMEAQATDAGAVSADAGKTEPSSATAAPLNAKPEMALSADLEITQS